MGSDNIIVNADGPGHRPYRPPGRLTFAAVLAVCVVALCGMALLVLSTDRNDRRAFFIGCGVLFLCVGGVGVYWLFNRARQASIVRLPNNHPLTYDQVARQSEALAAASLARFYDVGLADASRANPQLQSLNYNYQPRNETNALPALPDAAPPQIAPVAVDEWLPWIDGKAHVILAGQTGGGKTVTAKAILGPRIARQELAFAIDPHSSGWFDLPAVGGGQNWAEVKAALGAVVHEYLARMQERYEHYQNTGQELPHDHFPRLTVLVDEANEVRRFLDIAPKRGDTTPWQAFAEVLGSGARKVGISIILLMQSANVDDLGMSGLMRNNFARVALDPLSIQGLISQEETNKERRALLFTAIADQQFPAAMARKGQVHLLDRTGLDQRPTPTSAQASIWPGWAHYQQLLADKEQKQLQQQARPQQQVVTLADKVLDLLGRQPWQTMPEIAEALGEPKKTTQNCLNDLMDTSRVTRRGKTGQFQYNLP